MKITIKEKLEKEQQIPTVGQLWRHKNSDTIYMRIYDEVGRKALEILDESAEYFYSLDLGTGIVVFTLKNSDNIALLEQIGEWSVKEL